MIRKTAKLIIVGVLKKHGDIQTQNICIPMCTTLSLVLLHPSAMMVMQFITLRLSAFLKLCMYCFGLKPFEGTLN